MSDNTELNKTPGAKEYSKLAMAFSCIWIAALTILKGFGKIALSESDIITSGAAIVAVWSPTYMSIWLDKIKEINLGGKE